MTLYISCEEGSGEELTDAEVEWLFSNIPDEHRSLWLKLAVESNADELSKAYKRLHEAEAKIKELEGLK